MNIGRCGIYENRPEFCKRYPVVTSFMPEGCTFYFIGDERHGECDPTSCQENCCCAYPREGGEPLGLSMDPFVGGKPCKHLVWIEVEEAEKRADFEDEAPSITDELYNVVLEDMTPLP